MTGNQYFNNTKLIRELVNKETDNEPFIVRLNDEASLNVKYYSTDLISHSITQWDIVVLDSIYSLQQHGYDLFSMNLLCQFITGNFQKKMTTKNFESIINSINKLCKIYIQIDFTEERQKYVTAINKQFICEGPLLSLEIKGNSINMKEVSPLYRYANSNHQIINYPMEILSTKGRVSDTTQSIILKRYVVQKIFQIISSNKIKSNKLSLIWWDHKEKKYKGLFPELGYLPDDSVAWRKKKYQILKIIKNVLEVTKEKNIIIDFCEYRKNDGTGLNLPINGYKIFYEKKDVNKKEKTVSRKRKNGNTK